MLHDSKLSKWDSGQESQMKTQWIIAILWKCFQDSITTLKLFGCCNFFLEKGMAGVRCRGSLARCSLQTTVFALIWLHTSPLLQAFLWRYLEGYPRTGSAVAGVINAPEGKSQSLQSMGFRLFLQEGTSDPVKAPPSSQPPSQHLHSASLRLSAPAVATASLLLGTTYHE